MSLELYKRGEIWWIKGKIDELPYSQYYRKSTGTSNKASAARIVRDFQAHEVNLFHKGMEKIYTFGQAVLLYNPKPEFAKALIPVVQEWGEKAISTINPKMVRDLGRKLQPMNSTNTWHRHVVSPIRAVINNAHQEGFCAPIVIKAYTKKKC